MLNAPQKRAVQAQGHVLVTACPGSGKTRVLAHRAVHLLQHDRSATLGAVTFTRDAAAELRERIKHHAPEVARRVEAGTFHALCGQQLRTAGFRQRTIGEFEQQGIVQRICRQIGVSLPPDQVVRYIGARKAVMDGHVRFDGFEGSESDYRAISDRYDAVLTDRGMHDYGDLIQKTVLGMRTGRIKPLGVRYLLVDEFQDTDDTQLHWVLAHAQAGVEVTVVGDDDQSVYGFRNALGHAGMIQLRDHLQAQHISLDTTYRCAQSIVDAAGKLIKYNAARVPKELVTENPARGSVTVHVAADRGNEGERVVEAIQKHPTYAQWAVLSRTNAQLDELETACVKAAIPYRRLGGVSLWESFSGKLLLGVLKALDSGRLTLLEGVFNALCYSDEWAERLLKQPIAAGKVLGFARARPLPDEPSQITALRGQMQEWIQATANKQYNLTVYAIADWMKEVLPAKKLGTSLDLCVSTIASLKGSYGARIRWIEESKPKDGQLVTLMTLHKSKGLEFDHVWIVGCEAGKCPSKDSPLEEERRLFYVGMTRAKTNLHLSYTLGDNVVPSHFLEEAGLMRVATPAIRAAA